MAVLKHATLINVPFQGRVVYLISPLETSRLPYIREIVLTSEKLGHIVLFRGLVFVPFPLRSQNCIVRLKIGCLAVKVTCPSGVTCQCVECCFSELAL